MHKRLLTTKPTLFTPEATDPKLVGMSIKELPDELNEYLNGLGYTMNYLFFVSDAEDYAKALENNNLEDEVILKDDRYKSYYNFYNPEKRIKIKILFNDIDLTCGDVMELLKHLGHDLHLKLVNQIEDASIILRLKRDGKDVVLNYGLYSLKTNTQAVNSIDISKDSLAYRIQCRYFEAIMEEFIAAYPALINGTYTED